MTVLEIATFHLRPGVSEAAYLEADEAVERTHVSKQPGFISREIGTADDGQQIVVVHWADAASADASMAGFMDAPATADFMALVAADTMAMTRYTLRD
ncbi:MAG: antibiotic biosynthesis monooxygenase family protein [Acidimicrobiia bacterium]